MPALDRGEFELLVSRSLLQELARALAYPKLRRHIGREDADAVVRWVGDSATIVPDPQTAPPARSVDPGDDYLIAPASFGRAALVSGGRHLLSRAGRDPDLLAARVHLTRACAVLRRR